MKHKYPTVSDYWKMNPNEQRASTSFLDDLPNQANRFINNDEWFGVFGLTAQESLEEYGIAARYIISGKFECYAPDPDEEDCSIYFVTTEGDIEEQLSNHQGFSTFLLQHNLHFKQFHQLGITEKIYITSLHYDLIDLLKLDVDETFVRSEIELEDNEKQDDDIIINDNKPSIREENDVYRLYSHLEELSNLDLHEAMRVIIDNEGDEIINDNRLVNILSDYNCFDSIPASKFILKSIISEGYSKRMYAIGEWNSSCEALAFNYSSIKGFQSIYVLYVFQCLAYGLRWISLMGLNVQNVLFAASSSNRSVLKIKLSTKEQKEQYLLSKIVILNDIREETGLEVSNFSFDIINSKEFRLNCEINGTIKNSYDSGFYIKLVIYDDKNKIRYNDDLGYYYIRNTHYQGFAVHTKNINFPIGIVRISKIAIFV